MSRSYFKIVSVCDIERYIGLEDECFVYMTKNISEFIVCKNTSRELFKLGGDEIFLVACGSSKYCSSVARYLRNIEFDIIELETNGHVVEHISSVLSGKSKYIKYKDFTFSLVDNVTGVSLVGVNTVLMNIVSDAVLEATRLLDNVGLVVDMHYSNCTDYSAVRDNNLYKLSLYGNPLEALFKFINTIDDVAYNKLNKSKFNELLSVLKCLNSNGVPYDWAYVDIDSKGMLCLDIDDLGTECDSLGMTSIFNTHTSLQQSGLGSEDDDIII